MLFLYIFVTIALLAWIIFPLLQSAQTSSGDPLLNERIESLENALRGLHKDGPQKVSKEDFSSIERQIMLKLAKLLHQTGVNPKPANEPVELASAPAESKDSEVVTSPKFCGQCGHGISHDFAFCPKCGRQLHAA